jgi:hypothetical protein
MPKKGKKETKAGMIKDLIQSEKLRNSEDWLKKND